MLLRSDGGKSMRSGLAKARPVAYHLHA